MMISTSSRCPNCSDTCPPDAVFCISCGAALRQPTTSTTRLLRPQRPLPVRQRQPAHPHSRRSVGQLLIRGSVTAFGLALLTLLILVAYVGSYRPGLDPVAWLFVLAGAIHLVRETRCGEPLRGMRWAVLCAALPFAQVTQAFITTTVLFGGAFELLAALQFVMALAPTRRWWP